MRRSKDDLLFARAQALRNLEQHQYALGHILELLEKADARRRAEIANQRKWNNVLNNLEAGLAEARARKEACEVELRLIEAELAGQGPPEGAADGAVVFEAEQASRALPEQTPELVRHVMGLTFEQLSSMNLEEVSQIHARLTGNSSASADPAFEPAMGRLELANQTRDLQDEDAPPQEQRRQQALRDAIEKIRANRLDLLSPDETRLIISSYELLSRRLKPTLRDERLKRILGAAVKVLTRRQQKSDPERSR